MGLSVTDSSRSITGKSALSELDDSTTLKTYKYSKWLEKQFASDIISTQAFVLLDALQLVPDQISALQRHLCMCDLDKVCFTNL